MLRRMHNPNGGCRVESKNPYDHDELKAEIAKRWNSGMNATAIGREMRITRGSVMGHVWRMRRKGVELR